MKYTLTFIALLLLPTVALHAQRPANPAAREFAALPTDIGERFLKASLTLASLQAMATPTPEDPTGKYNPFDGPKVDTRELSGLLLLKSTNGPVGREEIQALEDYRSPTRCRAGQPDGRCDRRGPGGVGGDRPGAADASLLLLQ